MRRQKFLISIEARYEVEAPDQLTAQLAVAGVSAGCQDDMDPIGRTVKLVGCFVAQRGIDFIETTEAT